MPVIPYVVQAGATWNVELVEQVARVIAIEASASGNDRGFSPEINVRAFVIPTARIVRRYGQNTSAHRLFG
jgi:beta-glucosidase-like glycosyl hydrolase